MPRKTSSQADVFNTTGLPIVFNTAGQQIDPGDTRAADTSDPITKLYLAKGFLIVKEG